MTKFNKLMLLTSVACILLLGGQHTAFAQEIQAPRQPPTSDGPSSPEPSSTPPVLSTKKRLMLDILKGIADAMMNAVCKETGDCAPTGNTTTDTSTSGASTSSRLRMPVGFAGPVGRPSASKQPEAPKQWNFSFDTPAGWQRYEDQTSVTVAPASEYINGNLINGVILGLFDLNNSSYEAGTETYVKQLVSSNSYLRRIGTPESNAVDTVPCITNRMEGLSPKTHYTEQVVVYTCKLNPQKLFYVVTVNSGPNANRYEENNKRLTQTINFHR